MKKEYRHLKQQCRALPQVLQETFQEKGAMVRKVHHLELILIHPSQCKESSSSGADIDTSIAMVRKVHHLELILIHPSLW